MNIIVTGGVSINSKFCNYMLKKYPDYLIICLNRTDIYEVILALLFCPHPHWHR